MMFYESFRRFAQVTVPIQAENRVEINQCSPKRNDLITHPPYFNHVCSVPEESSLKGGIILNSPSYATNPDIYLIQVGRLSNEVHMTSSGIVKGDLAIEILGFPVGSPTNSRSRSLAESPIGWAQCCSGRQNADFWIADVSSACAFNTHSNEHRKTRGGIETLLDQNVLGEFRFGALFHSVIWNDGHASRKQYG
jgi:hypothetical protein